VEQEGRDEGFAVYTAEFQTLPSAAGGSKVLSNYGLSILVVYFGDLHSYTSHLTWMPKLTWPLSPTLSTLIPDLEFDDDDEGDENEEGHAGVGMAKAVRMPRAEMALAHVQHRELEHKGRQRRHAKQIEDDLTVVFIATLASLLVGYVARRRPCRVYLPR
jgi:hypothetical protein